MDTLLNLNDQNISLLEIIRLPAQYMFETASSIYGDDVAHYFMKIRALSTDEINSNGDFIRTANVSNPGQENIFTTYNQKIFDDLPFQRILEDVHQDNNFLNMWQRMPLDTKRPLVVDSKYFDQISSQVEKNSYHITCYNSGL